MKSSTGRGWRGSASWRPTRCWPSPLNACWSRALWVCRVCGCSSYASRSIGTSPRCAATRTRARPNPPKPSWRSRARRLVVRHYELSRPAYQLLHALLEGASVGQAFSGALKVAGSDLELLPHNLWTWFHDWAAEGFFRAVELG